MGKRKPKKKTLNTELFRYIDTFNRQKAPSKNELVKDFEGVAYTCATKNAQGVGRTKLRLYVKSGTGQKTRWKGNNLRKKTKTYLDRKFSFDVEDQVVEVADRSHPIIKLLEQPNPVHDGRAFVRYSQLYLEIVGTAYWRIDYNAMAVPQSLWILPPQQVKQLDNGNFAFQDQRGQVEYPAERIVRLTFDNLQDPYGEGYSPLRAVYEQYNIGNKLLAHMATQLDNQARPDTLVMGDFGDAEADRYEYQINTKFKRNNGGIAVLSTDSDGKPEIKPLTFSPRDMSVLSMLGWTKVEVANAFSVPMAMLETKDVNRANLTASREMHAKDAILPRCDALEVVFNNQVVSLFDSTGRTFVAFDNPSPEDRELDISEATAQAQQLATLTQARIVTQNEARAELQLEPVEGGDDFYAFTQQVETGQDIDTEPQAEPSEAPKEEPDPAAETQQEIETAPEETLNGAQIQAAANIVSQVAQGLLPRDAGIGQLEVLLNLSREQAERVMGSVGAGFQPPANDSEPTAPKGLPVIQEGQNKGYKLPDGKKLTPILVKHFERQQTQVLGSLKKSLTSKKALPDKFVPVEEWTEDLAKEVKPVVEFYLENGSNELISNVGASPDIFSVTDPNIQKWLEQYVFDFAESTVKTTTKMLNDALSAVKDELSEGMDAGEAVNALTRRIQNVFENGTKQRAQLIAKTESQRAFIQGFQKTAVESGVVEGFKHLTSSDPCPEVCQPLSGKMYSITDNLPPFNTHPGCECSVEAILTED